MGHSRNNPRGGGNRNNGGRGGRGSNKSFNTNSNNNNRRNNQSNNRQPNNNVNMTNSSTTTPVVNQQKNLNSPPKCETFSDSSNPATWLLYLNDQLKDYIAHNTLTEYFETGKINGKTVIELTQPSLTYPQVTAIVHK
jgi:hypothetical protein